MENVIIDLSNVKLIDFADYKKVFLVGYAKDNINDLILIKEKNSNIELILPNNKFDKSYQKINSYLANFVNKDINLLSLFKLCKLDLFNIGMILLLIEKSPSAYICTQYNNYLIELGICKKSHILKSRSEINYSLLIQFGYLFLINLQVILLFIKSFFIKPINVKKLFIDYEANRVFSFIKDNKSARLVKFHDKGKYVDFIGIKIFYKQQKKFFSLAIKYKILYQTIAKQAYHLSIIISLVSQNKPKVVVGAMDTYPAADLYSDTLKLYNIKFGCYSHSYNYNFRTDYIFIPFDFYFIWSKAHYKHVSDGQHIKSNCKFYVTGCPFYNNVNFRELKKKNLEQIYDILVIGEYYLHDYSAQPFNTSATLKLAEVLKKYKEKIKICVRPRFHDEYYHDMFSVLKDNVIYSFPENETTASTSIMKDIKRSKVVISMLSGGMHDALIIDKPIIQANFLGIVEPKGLDSHNAVYYADSVSSLTNLIDDFFKGKLEKIDNKYNKKYFLNNGQFNLERVKEVIHQYL
jgi:hypothetical protein